MKHCVNCGAELADNAKFCNKCGFNQEMNTQPKPAVESKQDNNKPSKSSGKGPLIAIIIIIVLILGISAVIVYLKKDQLFNNTGNQSSIEKSEKADPDEDEEEESGQLTFSTREELLDAYIAAIKEGDEDKIKAFYDTSEEDFSLEEHDALFMVTKQAGMTVENITVDEEDSIGESEVEEGKAAIKEWIRSLDREELSSKESGSGGSGIVDIEQIKRHYETMLKILTDNKSSELYYAALEADTVKPVPGDKLGGTIPVMCLIQKNEDDEYIQRGVLALLEGSTSEEAAIAVPAAEVAAAAPAAIYYDPLNETSNIAATSVTELVKRIDAMRVATDQYVNEGAEYVLIGDVTDRSVIYCTIGQSDSEMKSLMEENGYHNYTVKYYFDNPVNGDTERICIGPNCAHLEIDGKDYWYYFANNNLIRRKAQGSVSDNPETNGFIKEIYRMGYDCASGIISRFGDYILPDSDSRLISEEELQGMSKESLKLASNEIYARHGRKFKDPDIQEYFNNRSWYYGTIEADAFSESMLTKIEKENVALINSLRNQME